MRLLLLMILNLIISACSDSGTDIDKESVARGGKLFSRVCASCHSINVNEHRIGPSLAGVYNSRSGSKSNYNYSKALINANLYWDEKTLKQFLMDPAAMVPGTNMVDNNLNDQKAFEIIEYLRTH